MAKVNVKPVSEVEQERRDAERKSRVEQKRAEVKEEVRTTQPPQDQAGLADRQRKVEIALGLADPDV